MKRLNLMKKMELMEKRKNDANFFFKHLKDLIK